ncbi:MAG TPA: hypothetical protein VHP83_06520 [Aggregatilineaceae bacterium]|nr:hypothetical protein [Aggregatilineaceae bacterium]
MDQDASDYWDFDEESPDDGFSPDEDQADFLRNLGLFPGYDPAQIPHEEQLAQIATDICDEWLSFISKNRQSPQKILNLLEDISDYVIAAVNTKGDHREKVIRLGLSLRSDYWLSRGMWKRWRDTLMPVLKTALSLPNYELVTEAYRQWGIFLYLSSAQDGSQIAFNTAIEYAETSKDPRLSLMAHAERLNAQAAQLPRLEVEAQATAILASARGQNNVFVMGRVYLTLARTYAHQNLYTENFMAAQQAFLYFARAGNSEYVLSALSQMISALSYQYQDTYSPHYKQHLLRVYRAVAKNSASPHFQANVYHYQGFLCFQKQNYQQARSYIIRAWSKQWSLRQYFNCAIEIHMLGMIESKRKNWLLAEQLFTTAIKRYHKLGNRVKGVQARYARAYLPFEKQDFEAAVSQLEAVLPFARQIEEQAVRDQLIADIQADIDAARRNLVQAPV